MVGFKVSPKFKAFLQKMAKEENRSLSNFIINAVLTYIKEHHNSNWQEEDSE